MMPYTHGMKDARLELRIERGLMDRVDAARGDVSRTRWVERALESALGNPVATTRTGSVTVRMDAEAAAVDAPKSPPAPSRASGYAKVVTQPPSQFPAKPVDIPGVRKGTKYPGFNQVRKLG